MMPPRRRACGALPAAAVAPRAAQGMRGAPTFARCLVSVPFFAAQAQFKERDAVRRRPPNAKAKARTTPATRPL